MMTLEDARPWFEEALQNNPLLTMDDLQSMLESGRGCLWSGARSAVFVRLTDTDHGLIAEVGPAGGDMEEILAGVPKIEEWARNCGAKQALVWSGRMGWARALKPQGYELWDVVIRKDLT
jgi:hypothetical protein